MIFRLLSSPLSSSSSAAAILCSPLAVGLTLSTAFVAHSYLNRPGLSHQYSSRILYCDDGSRALSSGVGGWMVDGGASSKTLGKAKEKAAPSSRSKQAKLYRQISSGSIIGLCSTSFFLIQFGLVRLVSYTRSAAFSVAYICPFLMMYLLPSRGCENRTRCNRCSSKAIAPCSGSLLFIFVVLLKNGYIVQTFQYIKSLLLP